LVSETRAREKWKLSNPRRVSDIDEFSPEPLGSSRA
jgi:hypothetical protein